jgi:hypothetical protein
MGRRLLGLEQAEETAVLEVEDPRIDETFIRALLANGMIDSAVAVGVAGAARFPGSAEVLEAYGEALAQARAADRLTLLEVRQDWLARRLVAAQARLDSLASEGLTLGGLDVPCVDIAAIRTPVEGLRPDLWDQLILASGCQSLDVSLVSQ